MKILGIDIGGTGIKGALVDIDSGSLVTDRYRIDTPEGAAPQDVADVVNQIVKHFDYSGPIGCGFPAVVQKGITKSAANVSDKWINLNAAELLRKTTGCPVNLLNDADAAGLAEMAFGVGKGRRDSVALITIGTGIGVALFSNGQLWPNAELGHLEVNGREGEAFASKAVRKEENLSWEEFGDRLNEYLSALEKLIWPDLFILGGGDSKNFDEYRRHLVDVEAEVIPAEFLNEAGIVGAALSCQKFGH